MLSVLSILLWLLFVVVFFGCFIAVRSSCFFLTAHVGNCCESKSGMSFPKQENWSELGRGEFSYARRSLLIYFVGRKREQRDTLSKNERNNKVLLHQVT